MCLCVICIYMYLCIHYTDTTDPAIFFAYMYIVSMLTMLQSFACSFLFFPCNSLSWSETLWKHPPLHITNYTGAAIVPVLFIQMVFRSPVNSPCKKLAQILTLFHVALSVSARAIPCLLRQAFSSYLLIFHSHFLSFSQPYYSFLTLQFPSPLWRYIFSPPGVLWQAIFCSFHMVAYFCSLVSEILSIWWLILNSTSNLDHLWEFQMSP